MSLRSESTRGTNNHPPTLDEKSEKKYRFGTDAMSESGGVSLAGSTFENRAALGLSGWKFDEELIRAAPDSGKYNESEYKSDTPHSGITAVGSDDNWSTISRKSQRPPLNSQRCGQPVSRTPSRGEDAAISRAPRSSRERFSKPHAATPELRGHYEVDYSDAETEIAPADDGWKSDDEDNYIQDDDSDDD